MDFKDWVEWKTCEGSYGMPVPGLANTYKEDQSAGTAGVMVYSLLLLAMIVTIIVTAPAPASAANIGHGKFLYEQHCTRCHDTRVHTRPDRRIGSLEALQSQVQRCEHNASVNWPQQDVDDVVGYLDANFYKFGGGAQK